MAKSKKTVSQVVRSIHRANMKRRVTRDYAPALARAAKRAKKVQRRAKMRGVRMSIIRGVNNASLLFAIPRSKLLRTHHVVCPALMLKNGRVLAQDGRVFTRAEQGHLVEVGHIGARGKVVKNARATFLLPVGSNLRMVEVRTAGHRTDKQMEAVRAMLPLIKFACCDPFTLLPKEKKSRAKPKAFWFTYYDHSSVLRSRVIAPSGRTLREVATLDVVAAK